MADDLRIDPGDPSGPEVATDEVGGKHYQRVKLTWGPDGTANEVDSVTPLPVVQAAIDGNWKVYRNADFTSGPVVHDVNTDLARDGTHLVVFCLGPGAITLETSNDGATYGDVWPMEAGESFDMDALVIDSIRVDLEAVLESSYKIMVA